MTELHDLLSPTSKPAITGWWLEAQTPSFVRRFSTLAYMHRHEPSAPILVQPTAILLAKPAHAASQCAGTRPYRARGSLNPVYVAHIQRLRELPLDRRRTIGTTPRVVLCLGSITGYKYQFSEQGSIVQLQCYVIQYTLKSQCPRKQDDGQTQEHHHL